MTAPAPPRPAPTVRRAQSRAAAWLARAALLPLVVGIFGAALAVIGRRYGAAIVLAAVGGAIAAVPAAAAAVLAIRQARLNPWPAIVAVAAVAAVTGWVALPACGAGWARLPLAVAAAAGAWRASRAGLAHRRGARALHRWAQALAPVLSQRADQLEQVIGGLARTASAERVTDPHYAAAPGAAWNLRVTRWDPGRTLTGPGARVRLLLPAHADITAPDFLAGIKEALLRRAAVPGCALHVDPQRDQITIDVTAAGAAGEPEETIADRAASRVVNAAGMFLKGVKVTSLEIDEEAAAAVPDGAGIAGAGHALSSFAVAHDPARMLTSADNRDKFTEHMSTQLYGVPDQLRAEWEVDSDRVTFRKRRPFPAVIPARPYTREELREMFGDRITLPLIADEDQDIVGWSLSKTTLPHGMVIGPTGGGKTQLLLLIAMRATAQGVEVWGADPKMVELMGLRGWPGVTKIATRVPDMVKLIADMHKEMYQRFDDIASGRARLGSFQRRMLILDEYFVFCMLAASWWAAVRTKDDPKECPVFGQVAELLALSRSADFNIVLGVQRPDAALFDLGARDNIGWRCALGRLSPQGAQMVFGDYHTGTDLPLDEPGLCTVTTPKGPRRGKGEWVPNPAHALTGSLSDADMTHLRSLLPAGARWDGPLPEDAPDPGFEDSAAAGQAIAADPATGFLYLLRLALSARTAHLVAAPAGGPPADGEHASQCGWGPGPGGNLEPGGACIGAVSDDGDGRRIWLHPDKAYAAAEAYAAELGQPRRRRPEIDEALRRSGLLRTEQPKDGEVRYTVRRPLPAEGRTRVWDLPEDAILATPRSGDPAAAAPPLQFAAAPASQSAAAPPPQSATLSAVRVRNAEDLAEGDRIILYFEDGEDVRATVFSVDHAPVPADGPEDDGVPAYDLNYIDEASREPGTVTVRGDYPIRLAPPGPAPGDSRA